MSTFPQASASPDPCMAALGVASPTKLVRIRLAALVRVEYVETVEVPVDTTAAELDSLVDERYDKVDGGSYAMDPDYWQRGHCDALEADLTDVAPSVRVRRDAQGNLVMDMAQDNDGGELASDGAAPSVESCQPVQRRVVVGYGYMGSTENFLLGVWDGTTLAREEAESQALDALWDSRLDAASCSPRLLVSDLNCPDQALPVVTLSGQRLLLTPVPSSVMPSLDPQMWLKFLGQHVEDGDLSAETAVSVQRFMATHQTESLTDGAEFYTLDGDALAYCNPSVAQQTAQQTAH
jgi:hypothetical protein